MVLIYRNFHYTHNNKQSDMFTSTPHSTSLDGTINSSEGKNTRNDVIQETNTNDAILFTTIIAALGFIYFMQQK